MMLSGSCWPTVGGVTPEFPFDPPEEVELRVGGLIDPVAGRFGDLFLIKEARPVRASQEPRFPSRRLPPRLN